MLWSVSAGGNVSVVSQMSRMVFPSAHSECESWVRSATTALLKMIQTWDYLELRRKSWVYIYNVHKHMGGWIHHCRPQTCPMCTQTLLLLVCTWNCRHVFPDVSHSQVEWSMEKEYIKIYQMKFHLSCFTVLEESVCSVCHQRLFYFFFFLTFVLLFDCYYLTFPIIP